MEKFIPDIEAIFPWLQKPTALDKETFHKLIALFFGAPGNALNNIVEFPDELIGDVLVEMKLIKSKSEFYRAVKAQSLKLNNILIKKESKVSDFTFIDVEEIEFKVGVLKTGKISHEIILI